MTRNWKPGDIALRVTPYSDPYVALRVHGCAGARLGHTEHWHFVSAKTRVTQCGTDGLAEYRPLVVIDPEDREQIKRLANIYCSPRVNPGVAAIHELAGQRLQNALREFADPTPPKPDEPTGHMALVEDRDGTRWVNWRDPRDTAPHLRPWVSATDADDYREWCDVAAVRVLWEGLP